MFSKKIIPNGTESITKRQFVIGDKLLLRADTKWEGPHL